MSQTLCPNPIECDHVTTSVRFLSGSPIFRTQFIPVSKAPVGTCGFVPTGTLHSGHAGLYFLECLRSFSLHPLLHMIPSLHHSLPSWDPFFLIPCHIGLNAIQPCVSSCSSSCQTELCSLHPLSRGWWAWGQGRAVTSAWILLALASVILYSPTFPYAWSILHKWLTHSIKF